MKLKIKNDIFDINRRIKRVNSDFEIFFNFERNSFEIRSKKTDEIIFTLPYKTLDERSIKFVIKKIKKTNEEILEEIDKHNELKQKEIDRKIKNEALVCAENVLRGVKK